MRNSWILLVLAFHSFSARADEGMWTLNGFPSAKVEKKYGFRATPEWLEKVRLASARLAGGCSGSFVSPHGLVMTNHHCAHECIEDLSTSGRDYVAEGFFAKEGSDEHRCPTVEINRLVEIKDVTKRIQGATKGLSGAPFNDAQKAEMSKTEKECSGESDRIRCEVVTLYNGGKFDLYRYQRYQDVRLVFAPEKDIAFFGGDPDNFMFPRFDLDVSFLRVYEDGKPLSSDDYFRWSRKPTGEGDLAFVTGHPGRTSRLRTIAELEYQRDVQLIQSLIQGSELRGVLTEFGNRSAEAKRVSEGKLFGLENFLKASRGKLGALTDREFFAGKKAEEGKFRAKISSNPDWKKTYGNIWDETEGAVKKLRSMYFPYAHLEQNRFLNSKYYEIAFRIVRASQELPKPNGKRFREYTDSKLPELKQELFSEAPIYDDFEIAMLTFSLTKLRENLRVDHPAVKRIFGARSPAEIAEAAVRGTKLKSVELRKKLFDGGKIEETGDTMIELARVIEREARVVREKYETEIEPILKKNGERLAKARFAIEGTGNYPDATFTLRVSYGKIAGYTEEDGTRVDPVTTMKGAFDRHTGRDPFALPKTWLAAKDRIDLSTPLNFCSTNDIIGGNSGSPVINRNREVVGLIFDGNIQSLGGDYGFDERVNRAVAVHSAAIPEALRKIYGAGRIADEILPPDGK